NNTVNVEGTAGSGVEFNGIGISGSGTGKWTISHNQLDGGDVGSSGIRLLSSLPGTAKLEMTRTKVTGWENGIKSDNLAAGTKVEIWENWIHDNNVCGIQNGSGESIDVILNYWGDVSGPYHATTNTGGEGNEVSDKVDYDPWYQDEDFISISNGTVHNQTQNKYYRAIQIAIDDANAGDVIQVAPGIYYEEVQVKKGVTLRGDIGNPDEAGCGENAPVIDGSNLPSPFTNCGFQIKCDGVVIEGFEIKNFQREGLQSTSDNVILRHNHIHDVSHNEFAQGGIWINGTSWEVTYNLIESVPTGITVGESSDSLIARNNICDISGDGIHFELQEVSKGHQIASGVIISDNEITDIGGVGIYVLAWPFYNYGQVTIQDITISGNTVITDGTNAIMLWGYGPGIHELWNMTITNNNVTVYYPSAIEAPDGINAIRLDNIRGNSTFSGNTINVVGDRDGYCEGILVCGWDTGNWTIEDNIIDGHCKQSSYGIYYFWIPQTAQLNISGNTFTGWASGIRGYDGSAQVTLRSNRIFDNNKGVQLHGPTIDAQYNYWGNESGPYHESLNPDGLGNPVDDGVDFDPWYIDLDCTISTDQEAMDQQHVDEAIELVPGIIAEVIVSGGDAATAEAKTAAVKEHIENLEGMAALGVAVAVEAGTPSGYKITITKGAAEASKDNVRVTEFVVPPADQEAADAMVYIIDPLPLAGSLNLGNLLQHLPAIEVAEAAYEALTEPQKALVSEYLVTKLNNTVAKAEALVLEELDNRIDSAIDNLMLGGTGIEAVQFAGRKATLIVNDPDKKVYEFIESGVIFLFQSMFQDVVEMKLGDDPTWYGVDGTSTQGAMEAGAHIVSVLLGLDYVYGEPLGGVFSQLSAANLGQLINKDLSIEVKIERLKGGKKYQGTYVIEFTEADQ
ncbi:MAG: DUF1565 domain-containing protein, partial [Firmicutes bacterium]|nr:DUF1565 domain-containing protein [Bacillota bacterium]